MSSQPGPRMAASANELELFKGPERLSGGNGLELELTERYFYSDDKIPGYEYAIKVSGEYAGTCTLLIESDIDKIASFGNVGMEIERKFYGKQLVPETIKAVYDVFKIHAQNNILVVFDDGKRSVAQACEELGGRYIANYISPEGKVIKKRFVISI